MVKRIDSYRFSKKFKKQYNAMPNEIQQAFNETHNQLFLDNLY